MDSDELKIIICKSKLKGSSNNYVELAERRLKLLQDILDICYNYDYDLEKLKKHLYKILDINSMKERQIIDFEQHRTAVINLGTRLSPTEVDLHCLLCYNFSPRELRIVFNHKHHESIYNRISRIKRKFKQEI